MKRAGIRCVKNVRELLVSIGIPRDQQNERSALTLLALADRQPRMSWTDATRPLRRITEMMDWMRDQYGVKYAPNTRETIRRQTVHQFVQHGLVLENPDEPNRPVNSPNWCYQLTPIALKLIQSLESSALDRAVAEYLEYPSATALHSRHRELPREIVRLPEGVSIELSAGGQNSLIRAVIEEFTPRFVRRPKVLLLGDAANKETIANALALADLGIVLPHRGKAPDVLVHDGERDWLIVVEAVTSHGPIDQKRKNEMEALRAGSRPGLVFITAFPDRKTFARFRGGIAWETDVWIADSPDHLIHYNGIRFLGPYDDDRGERRPFSS